MKQYNNIIIRTGKKNYKGFNNDIKNTAITVHSISISIDRRK